LAGERRAGGIGRRLALISIPIMASILFIIALWLTLSDAVFSIIGLLLLSYFISPFGKEVLVPTAIIGLLAIHGLAFMVQDIALVTVTVVFVDVMCSIFLLWNLDVLKLIPKVGKWIASVEKFGRKQLKKSRRRRRNTFVALTGYMALPFQGSGGIVSTIIGMMAGMKKKNIWMSVWIGSIAGTLSIAILSIYIGQALLDVFGSLAWYVTGMLIIFAIGLYIMTRFLKSKGDRSIARSNSSRW